MTHVNICQLFFTRSVVIADHNCLVLHPTPVNYDYALLSTPINHRINAIYGFNGYTERVIQ